MKKIPLVKICIYILVFSLFIGLIFYSLAHQQIKNKVSTSDSVSPMDNVGEILAGDSIEQDFFVNDDILSTISVFFQTYNRENKGHLTLNILEDKRVLYETSIDVSLLKDNTYMPYSVNLSNVKGKKLTLHIASDEGIDGSSVTIATGKGINVGRTNVSIDHILPMVKNGKKTTDSLCIKVTTINKLLFGQYYWWFFAAWNTLLTLYLVYLLWCDAKGRNCVGLRFIAALSKYRFLLHQLVDRDFKTKYKRSALGVLWSFLNPLLTMAVQYIVFSTLFKTDIPNYPLYLLSGIVCFSYFSEAVNQCMVSITGNANLITKVYVPKYIYPLSKAISSGVNLLLSLIPLLLLIVITGQAIHPSIFLLPFALVCLFLFSLGMGILLATAMVFFRDTQFLWSVIGMLWMYCTPIFYPESIIPENLMVFFKMNPLYHIIRFIRTVLISGVSPEPKAYLLCIITSVIPLLLGIWVFKKNQSKFVLYV